MNPIYLPFQISKMSAKEVSAAYSKLRSTANKRLERFESAGLGTYGSYRFPKVKNLTENQMRTQLAEASRYLRDPHHSLRYERKYIAREVADWQQKGYDFINESNIYDFYQFMEDLREQYGSKAFDSGDAADVFNNTQKIGIDPKTAKEHFEYFAEHMDALERMRPARTAGGATMPAIRRKIKRLE